MSMLVIRAAKAGQGASVTAAAIAITTAAAGKRTLLVDASTGDLPAIVGIAEPDTRGLTHYLTDPSSPSVDRLAVAISDHLHLLPLGAPDPTTGLDLSILYGGCDLFDNVIIDAGTRPHDGLAGHPSMLITRPCYLAMRRALAAEWRADRVILIDEPARALRAADIEAVLGIPVVATIPVDPTIARAVDAGLLATRLPTTLARAVHPILETVR